MRCAWNSRRREIEKRKDDITCVRAEMGGDEVGLCVMCVMCDGRGGAVRCGGVRGV
jgi:hypothetical protein